MVIWTENYLISYILDPGKSDSGLGTERVPIRYSSYFF